MSTQLYNLQVIITFYVAIVVLLVGANFRGGGWWGSNRCQMPVAQIKKMQTMEEFILLRTRWAVNSLNIEGCCFVQV
jgi:hypothetical protein